MRIWRCTSSVRSLIRSSLPLQHRIARSLSPSQISLLYFSVMKRFSTHRTRLLLLFRLLSIPLPFTPLLPDPITHDHLTPATLQPVPRLPLLLGPVPTGLMGRDRLYLIQLLFYPTHLNNSFGIHNWDGNTLTNITCPKDKSYLPTIHTIPGPVQLPTVQDRQGPIFYWFHCFIKK